MFCFKKSKILIKPMVVIDERGNMEGVCEIWKAISARKFVKTRFFGDAGPEDML